MKNILILGAGQSAPLLIRDLLHHAGEHDWRVTVADLNREAAAARLEGNPRGRAITFDAEAGGDEITAADLVVNLLPPSFQAPIAEQCVAAGRPMISASYTAPATRELDAAARERGVLILTEMGLDPGIDHMSTMELLDRLAREGAVVESFESYGSGVPATDSVDNPFGYAITWNPRNVVLAARDGAQFLRGGRVQVAPWMRIFEESWTVEVPGVGPMDAYPNRDSLAYREIFRLGDARTLIRGTLRHAGYCALWRHVVRIGLANDALEIPGLAELSFRELTDMFLPDGLPGRSVEERAAAYLRLDPDGGEMAGLRWLGLFSSDEPVAVDGTAVDALVALLYRKFKLPEGGRDMVILQHQLGVRREDGRRERITSWMVEHGEPGGITAMARTVGLPAAIAARLVLTGQLTETGVHIPTTPAFYEPVLAELDKAGIQFTEKSESG
ncbi:MAG: saccharopine dehydrogenase C-terminal domain-containing protein [Acidobacteriota bacterium]